MSVRYHIGLDEAATDGVRYALLPGDPDRVEPLARQLDANAFPLGRHREFTSWRVELDGLPVIVCSTGIGAPSTAIAIKELAELGLRRFVRVGTTGAIQERIQLGDLIVSEAAVRLEGTSGHYAPTAFPAAATLGLTWALVEAARQLDIPYHSGVTCSSDTFWPGQERYDSFSGYVPRHLQGSLTEWRALGVLNYEMEAAALFVMARALGLEAAAVCGAIARRSDDEHVATGAYALALDRLAQVCAAALPAHARANPL